MGNLCDFKAKVFVIFIICSLLQHTALAQEIRIGATLPLSGELATYGNLIQNGIELATEDLKKENINVKTFFEDIPLSGGTVVSGFNKLIQIDKVDGIAGNFSNVAMAAMAPSIERANIPTFHTAAADPLIIDAGQYIVTTNVRIKDEAYNMAEFLLEKLKLKRIAVISIQTNFGQAYRQFFIERLKQLGGELVADETFEIMDPEYKAQVLKIKNTKPDAVFAACFGRFLGYTLKQGKELGLTAPFFSVYESEDSSVLAAAGSAAEGLRYFVTTSSTSSQKYSEFRNRYINRYHLEPGTFGSNAYDATMILGRSLSKCMNDKQCALKEIYSIKDYHGVSGNFSIEQDGATKKGFVLKIIKNGQFIDA